MQEKKEKVNIYVVAQELGISSTTVSRALSGKGRVSEQTRARVLDYMEQNHLEPIVRMRSYTEKRVDSILVTLPKEKDFAYLPFFHHVILSIHDFFAVHGYQVMIAKTSAGDIGELEYIIQKHRTDGVILTRTIEDAIDIKFLQKKGVPFVTIGSYWDKSVYQVDVDQSAGCRDLTNALLRMGVREIVLFCANRSHIVTKSRLNGFLRAYEENGLEFDQRMLFDRVEDKVMAERLTENMLKRGVECILCMDDNICLNVLNTLRKNGVRVPRDVKVASFYNSQVLNEYEPPISCVDFDIRQLGAVASRTLLSLLQGDEPKSRIVLGYNVLLKESTQ